MRLEPGTYIAKSNLIVSLMRSNSIGSEFFPPAIVNERYVPTGETFDVPSTVDPFYYRTDEDSRIAKQTEE